MALVHGCHTLQTCLFAISYGFVLHGGLMWKELTPVYRINSQLLLKKEYEAFLFILIATILIKLF